MPGRDGLISTEELAGRIGQANLRIYDCTSYLDYQPEGSPVPYVVRPGKVSFEEGHIPGADFLDLQNDRFVNVTAAVRAGEREVQLRCNRPPPECR